MTIGELKKRLENFKDDQEILVRFAINPMASCYDSDIIVIDQDWKEKSRVLIHASLDTSKDILEQTDLEKLYETKIMSVWSQDAIVDGVWKDVTNISTDCKTKYLGG